MKQCLLRMPGERKRVVKVERKSREVERLSRVMALVVRATRARRDWESRLAVMNALGFDDGEDVRRMHQRYTLSSKLEMSQTINGLITELSLLVRDVVGSWRPAPGEVDTGLSDADLELLNRLARGGVPESLFGDRR